MIRPEEVQVEDACFHKWEEEIDAMLSKPWAEDEMHRTIELEHASYREVGNEIFKPIWRAYEELGWKISVGASEKRPDRFFRLRFARPRMFNDKSKLEAKP